MSIHARLAEAKLRVMKYQVHGQLGAEWEKYCSESLKLKHENNEWHVYCDGDDVGVIDTGYPVVWPKTENFSIAFYNEAGKPTVDFELYDVKVHIVGIAPHYVKKIEIVEEGE